MHSTAEVQEWQLFYLCSCSARRVTDSSLRLYTNVKIYYKYHMWKR